MSYCTDPACAADKDLLISDIDALHKQIKRMRKEHMATVFGVEVSGELPEGWQPLDVVCIVKCLKPDDGVPSVSIHTSEGLPTWEVFGLLECVAEDAKNQFLHALDCNGECGG